MKKLILGIMMIVTLISFAVTQVQRSPVRPGPNYGYWVSLGDDTVCPSGYVGSAIRVGAVPDKVIPISGAEPVFAKLQNGGVYVSRQADILIDPRAWHCSLYIKITAPDGKIEENGVAYVAQLFFDEREKVLKPLWNWVGYIRLRDLVPSGTLAEVSKRFEEYFSR